MIELYYKIIYKSVLINTSYHLEVSTTTVATDNDGENIPIFINDFGARVYLHSGYLTILCQTRALCASDRVKQHVHIIIIISNDGGTYVCNV